MTLGDYTLSTWLMFFYIYCVFGWCFESTYVSVFCEHRFVNRGFLTGPMLPLYGCGALTILLATLPVRDNIWLTGLVGMAACTLLEYITGVAMEAIFKDPGRAATFIDPYTFADDLYNVAADMYCLPELGIRFDDVFGEEGMIDGFRAYNASWCLWEGLMPGAEPSYYRVYPLLQNFLDEADEVIASGDYGLRLRFGHDSVVLPFAFALGFREAVNGTDDMENLHRQFSIIRLIPMAANIQWVFFRKEGSDDILVKFLMNENENETSIPIDTDCYPFYHWSDVSRYYRDMIESAHLTYQTPDEDDD